MYLIELYNLFNDDVEIRVIDSEGNILAVSDGKDSIPNELNNSEIYKIYPIDENKIDVEIYDVDSEEFMVENALGSNYVWSNLR